MSYYRARYYDPQAGRFLSEDPVNFYGGFNFYTYDDDDPVNFTDPWGLYHDDYNLDLRNHGAPHIDRVDRSGNLVGRYRPDGSGIPHKGKIPPRIPNRDRDKFQKAADELRRRTQGAQQCTSTPPPVPTPYRPDPTRIPWSECHPYLNCYIGEDGNPHRLGGSPSVPPALPAPGVPVTLPSLPPIFAPEPILVPIF